MTGGDPMSEPCVRPELKQLLVNDPLGHREERAATTIEEGFDGFDAFATKAQSARADSVDRQDPFRAEVRSSETHQWE